MNPFQAQYPLSQRKFWKKMISVIIGCSFTTILLLIVTTPFYFMLSDLGSTHEWLLIGTGGFVLLLVLWVLIKAWYWRAYINRYYYDASGNFITIRKGVFAPTEIHVQWQKIQDVYVDQDITDRIMGLYDVHIASATAASGIEAHIDGVEKVVAESLKNYLLNRITSPQQAVDPSLGNKAAAVATAPASYQFSESFSTTQYPIGGIYTARSLIGIFFTSIVVGAFVSFYFSLPGKHGTSPILQDFTSSVVAAVVIAILYFLGHLFTFLLWKRNYRFEFAPDFVCLYTGVFSRQEKHVPYRSIQDVTVSQSVLDRMFGLSNVVIENAATGPVGKAKGLAALNAGNAILIPGQTPENARKISDAIKSVVLAKNSSQTGL